MSGSRFALAKEQLQRDIGGVIAALFSGAKAKHRRRDRWNVVNPWRHGAEASQFSIRLNGPRAGGWIDFVSGEKGDAIDLVCYALEGAVSHEGRLRALEWTEARYGLRSLTPATRAKMQAEAEARRRKIEEEAAATQAQQRDRARRMFFACDPKLAGTPVEAYLAARGIRLADIPNISHAFRYRADCEYWPLAPRDGDGRRLGPGPAFPAMVSAMVSAAGKLNALHLTFLAADGSGKAPVGALAERAGLDPKDFSAKLFKGDVGGFVIRVTNGPSGLPMEEASERGVAGPAGVTEGIEDAFSAAIAEPRLRMIAAGSLSGMLTVPDHASVSAWAVFRDNDWNKPAARKLFDRALSRFAATGKPAEAVAMPADWGKDVNDALNMEV